MAEARLERCPGCGAQQPAADGARHPYVGASSACWTRFSEVSATLPLSGTARLVIDAYMVQHPGVPERRAIQSVCLHLVGLCLVLEHGLAPGRLSTTLQRILRDPPRWRWLEPPVPNGDSTIFDVSAALARDDAPDIVDAYVRGIWSAWVRHHATVEAWVLRFA